MAEGFTGMAQLIADLQALGPKCAGESGKIVPAHANSAAVDIRSSYPVVEGNLRDGVTVEDRGPLVKQVVNKAPHAHIYERGTVARYTHSTGAGRGTMPAGNKFIPRAIKWRARMNEQLVNMVRRQKVRGMTGTLDVVERGGD